MPEIRPQRIAQAQEILDEHKRLHGYLEKIEAALSAPPRPEAVGAWLASLASSLQELLPLLRAHFAREDEGGLFEEIEAAWPNAARVCERLRGEHEGLLARFGRLRAETEVAPADEEALQALVARARSLSRDLTRHEEAENELLFRSLDDAVAAQD